MRKYLLILLPLLLSALPAWSMNLRADTYFNELPLRPPSPCSQKREVREQFNNQVADIAERLDEDIREREQVIKAAKRKDSKKMQEAAKGMARGDEGTTDIELLNQATALEKIRESTAKGRGAGLDLGKELREKIVKEYEEERQPLAKSPVSMVIPTVKPLANLRQGHRPDVC